jgi:tRNA G46 methylase TrmB
LDDCTPSRFRGDSSPVVSNQSGPHEDLARRLGRHLVQPWRQPLHEPTVRAFERVAAWRRAEGEELPLVLDAGCGTGVSTRRLAKRHPGALVIGVDRSAARLRRGTGDESWWCEGPVLCVRAELDSFWRLAASAGWRPAHHYLLYPNPWPKAKHLGRRWHGHPVFPVLVGLGGMLELRSNWRVYVQEFSEALRIATGAGADPERIAPGAEAPLSPFEAKYAASAHALWRLRFKLP